MLVGAVVGASQQGTLEGAMAPRSVSCLLGSTSSIRRGNDRKVLRQRPSVAASVLRNAGFDDVSDILGGYGAWTEMMAPSSF